MATATESSLLANLLKQPSYAEQLGLRASSTAPNPSWGGALAQALQGGLAGLMQGGEEDKDKRAALIANGLMPVPGQPGGLAAALTGPPPQPAMQPPPTPQPSQRLATALAGPTGETPASMANDGGNRMGGVNVVGMEPPPYHADEHSLDSMRPSQDAIKTAMLGGQAALPPNAQPTMGQTPQPPQQMAQAQTPSAAIPQPIRQATEPPAEIKARAEWLIMNGGKSGPAQAAALLEPYRTPKEGPPSIQEYQLYKQQGGTDDYTTWDRKNKTAGATLINTTEGMGAAQQKARIGIDTHAIEDLSKKAVAGRNAMPLLRQVIDLAGKTPGGWAGSVSPTIARGLSGMGFEVPDNMSNAELLSSISRQFIPAVRDPGSTSNYEQQLYTTAVPGLSQSVEGRQKIARMMQGQIERTHDILQIYRQHVGEPELVDKLRELENKPMFSKEDRAAAEQAVGGNATGAGITPEQAMRELQRRKGGSL